MAAAAYAAGNGDSVARRQLLTTVYVVLYLLLAYWRRY